MTFLLLVIVLFVAYANGANDTFKGVATLLGTGSTTYRRALAWALAATFAGSVTAIALSAKLISAFSGAGLVPDALTGSTAFIASVGIGAAATVLIATRLSMPISTTHALTGALVGGGLVMAGMELRWGALGVRFLLPLLLSPLAALLLTVLLYPVLRFTSVQLGVRKESCVCVEERPAAVIEDGPVAFAPTLAVTTCDSRAPRYEGRLFACDAQHVAQGLHFLSAGAMSFARGLNDTPKIVALLLAAQILNVRGGMILVALAMAGGGLLQARRVAETMSRKITPMSQGQGFTASIVTSGLVIAASIAALPVSTTQVSCGALFGIGVASKGARREVILSILLAWVVTLPLAAVIAGAAAFGLR